MPAWYSFRGRSTDCGIFYMTVQLLGWHLNIVFELLMVAIAKSFFQAPVEHALKGHLALRRSACVGPIINNVNP